MKTLLIFQLTKLKNICINFCQFIGEFIKVKEPEKSSEGSRKKLKAQKAESSLTPKIDTLFSSGSGIALY